MKVCNRAVYQSAEVCFEAQRQTSSSVMETLQNITSVFSSLCRTQREDHFRDQVEEQQRKETQHQTIYQSTLHLTRYVVFMTVSLLLLSHHYFPPSAMMETEELVAFLLILSRLQPIASTMSMDISNTITGGIAHRTLLDLERDGDVNGHMTFGQQEVPASASFKIRDLGYAYTDSESTIEHWSAHFSSRALHVIHGPSGCGKSTLLHLMSGLLPATSGLICLDEVPLQDISEKEFFQHVALVPQDAEFFMMSLRENLCLGLDEPASDRDIMDLAKMCSCDEGISSKGTGLDTNMYSLGKNMSGGQKKKLMILRALLRRPKILLCDEPTSGLDEASSEEIFALFQNLKRTMTLIVVSHDHKLIEMADGRHGLGL
jgi:ABC-type bacteriocin/lantibiotic exporter with double-glycine peptidase domain